MSPISILINQKPMNCKVLLQLIAFIIKVHYINWKLHDKKIDFFNYYNFIQTYDKTLSLESTTPESDSSVSISLELAWYIFCS